MNVRYSCSRNRSCCASGSSRCFCYSISFHTPTISDAGFADVDSETTAEIDAFLIPESHFSILAFPFFNWQHNNYNTLTVNLQLYSDKSICLLRKKESYRSLAMISPLGFRTVYLVKRSSASKPSPMLTVPSERICRTSTSE